MAIITRLLQGTSGRPNGVDLTANTLQAQAFATATYTFTDTIFGYLLALQNGTDFSNGTNSHTHDGRYFTKTLLQSTTGGSAGSTLIGDDNSYSHFTPGTATIKGALTAIDAALGTATNNSFQDSLFNIYNATTNTKKIAFSAAGISASTTRTITMPDANVDLGNLTNSNISASAAIAYSKLSLTGSVVNADIAAGAAIAYSKLSLSNSIVNADINSSAAIVYSKLSLSNSIVNADIAAGAAIAYSKLAALGGSTNAVLIQNGSGNVAPSSILSTNLFLADGTVSATGAFNMNSHKITSLTDPTSPQDAATKFYVDNLTANISWKNSARAASTANVSVSSAPASIDGVTLATNDRVLLKNQTAGAENGIYVFNGAGSALTRATDMSTWAEVVGAVLVITEGSTNTGSKWISTNVAGGTLGTTTITFTAFSVAGTVSGAGTGNYVAYWNGTASLTAEQYLSAVRGGLGTDASAFTGVLKASAGSFSASSIVNADVSGSAAIAYSKLALTGSIVNADINGSAAIAYSKLALTNSIVNADISSSAAIVYSKLSLTGSVSLSDMAANSVDENKIVSTTFNAAGAITGGSGTKVAVQVDASSIEISSNALRIKTTAYDQKTITGGGGTAAAVQYSPAMVRTLVAGQAFSANTSYAVRWGLTANGETAGRVYAADITTTSFALYYVIGMASSGTAVSAGQNINVTSFGSFNLSSSDTAFASNTDGAPVFLTASGTFSTTAPSTATQAVTRIGVVQLRSATAASNIIDVSPEFLYLN